MLSVNRVANQILRASHDANALVLVSVHLTHVELHVIVQEKLMAAVRGLVHCRDGKIVGIAHKEILELRSNHGAHGVFVPIGDTRRDKLVVAKPSCGLILPELSVGLHHYRRLYFN